MIEKVPRAVVKVIFVEHPAVKGNRETHFPFLVPLAMKRQEFKSFFESEVEKRSGNGVERGSLIVTPVKPAKNPVELRHPDRDTGARIGGILVHRSVVVGETYAAVQSQPRSKLVLVLKKCRLQFSPES